MSNINFDSFKKCFEEFECIINNPSTWEQKWHDVFYTPLSWSLCEYGNIIIPDTTDTDEKEVIEFYNVCKQKYEYLKEVYKK